MAYSELLKDWSRRPAPLKTRESYTVRLPVDDAARLHALAELHPAVNPERIITDLLHVALDEIEAAMPYVPGARVIREDDFGDPVYEDAGMTPRFLELAREYEEKLSADGEE